MPQTLPKWVICLKHLNLYHCCHFSVNKSYLTLCDPMDCSTPGFPVLPRVCSNSCQLSWWCHLTISSSAAPFSFCFQSFPASGSFPMSQLFTSGGQSIGASALALIFPMNEYSGLISFTIDWFDLLSFQGTLKSLPQQPNLKVLILWCWAFFMVPLSYPYNATG